MSTSGGRKKKSTPAANNNNNDNNVNTSERNTSHNRLDEDELEARIARIRAQNAEIIKRQQISEQERQQALELDRLARERKEERERLIREKQEHEALAHARLMKERQANQQRKLAKIKQREWDAAKNSLSPNITPSTTTDDSKTTTTAQVEGENSVEKTEELFKSLSLTDQKEEKERWGDS